MRWCGNRFKITFRSQIRKSDTTENYVVRVRAFSTFFLFDTRSLSLFLSLYLCQSNESIFFQILHSDRLPNWTPLDRSSTSNPWRRCFGFLNFYAYPNSCAVRPVALNYILASSLHFLHFFSVFFFFLLWSIVFRGHVCLRRYTQTKGEKGEENKKQKKKIHTTSTSTP